jgi:aspartyl protease family protein
MMRHFICLSLLFFCAAAQAQQVALIGVIGGKAAVLAVDGGDPKTVKVGQSWHGVTVVSVEHDNATVQIDGQNRTLALGQHYRGTPPPSTRESATIAADARGHFFTDATINDMTVRSVVDTGASVVVLSVNDANRLGLDWRNGTRGLMQTANGTTSAYVVKLSKVKVGAIELHEIDGVVVEQGPGVALLGMSFLNRLEMKRDGDTMTLIRRF